MKRFQVGYMLCLEVIGNMCVVVKQNTAQKNAIHFIPDQLVDQFLDMIIEIACV